MTMLAPVKIDGFGTRRNATDAEVANTGSRAKFIRMFATTAVTKGECVALDFSGTEPTNGYGNHVVPALSATGTNPSAETNVPVHAIGIAAETVTAGEIVKIQIYGVCDFAQISDLAHDTHGTSSSNATAAEDDGSLLTVSPESGHLMVYDSSAAKGAGGDSLPLCIQVAYGSADTADSTVFLLNPANL